MQRIVLHLTGKERFIDAGLIYPKGAESGSLACLRGAY